MGVLAVLQGPNGQPDPRARGPTGLSRQTRQRQVRARIAGGDGTRSLEPRGFAEEASRRAAGSDFDESGVPAAPLQLTPENGRPRIVVAAPDILADGCQDRGLGFFGERGGRPVPLGQCGDPDVNCIRPGVRGNDWIRGAEQLVPEERCRGRLADPGEAVRAGGMLPSR